MEFVPPILHREFVVRSRDRATYFFRLITALVSFALALGFVVLPSLVGPGLSRNGNLGFGVCSWFLWLFCVVEGIRVSSDCLSGEKRDGTIGLLFLTRMGGFDVVIGKLSSGLVGSLFGLLAALPILGFLMLGGGVAGGEFFRICLALVSTLMLALSLGVLISACSFHAGRSLLVSGGILLAWVLGSMIAFNSFGVAMPSPWTLLAKAFDAEYQFDSSIYWFSMVMVWVIAGVCVATSGFVLRRHWQEGPEPRNLVRKEKTARWKRWLGFAQKRPLSDSHPISWLADWAGWVEKEKRFAGIVLVIGLLLAFIPPLANGFSSLVGWVLLGGLVWEGLRFFMGARSSGCLELILTTPIGVNEMLSQLHLLSRRFALNGAGLIFVVKLVGFIVGSLLAINWPAFGAVAGSGVIGMKVANGAWSDFLLQFLLKFAELGLGAIAGYYWFYGVYWYSLWRGAIGLSIASALGWIFFTTIVSFVFVLWIGTVLFMFPLMGASRFLSSSPFLVMLYISGIGSIITALYFNGLAKRAKRSLRGFLVGSSPLVHGMKSRGLPSFR